MVALRIACRSDRSLSASPGAFVETQLASQQADDFFLPSSCFGVSTENALMMLWSVSPRIHMILLQHITES